MQIRMSAITLLSVALITAAAFTIIINAPNQATAQITSQRPRERAPIPGLSRQPSEAASKVLLDPSDTVMLLLDHQTGLFQTVKDVPVAELRNNVMALASIAKLGGAPIIYTASEPNGPNGPLMDELSALQGYGQYVPRKGE